VEDHDDDVFCIQGAFEKAGLKSRLIVVRGGTDAIAYLNGEGKFADRLMFPEPDILLLDIKMPDIDGFEVLSWLRRQDRYNQLTVHMLSGSSQQSDVQRAYDLQATSYIIKPDSAEDLIEFVSALQTLYRFIRLPQKPIFWDGRKRSLVTG